MSNNSPSEEGTIVLHPKKRPTLAQHRARKQAREKRVPDKRTTQEDQTVYAVGNQDGSLTLLVSQMSITLTSAEVIALRFFLAEKGKGSIWIQGMIFVVDHDDTCFDIMHDGVKMGTYSVTASIRILNQAEDNPTREFEFPPLNFVNKNAPTKEDVPCA